MHPQVLLMEQQLHKPEKSSLLRGSAVPATSQPPEQSPRVHQPDAKDPRTSLALFLSPLYALIMSFSLTHMKAISSSSNFLLYLCHQYLELIPVTASMEALIPLQKTKQLFLNIALFPRIVTIQITKTLVCCQHLCLTGE